MASFFHFTQGILHSHTLPGNFLRSKSVPSKPNTEGGWRCYHNYTIGLSFDRYRLPQRASLNAEFLIVRLSCCVFFCGAGWTGQGACGCVGLRGSARARRPWRA